MKIFKYLIFFVFGISSVYAQGTGAKFEYRNIIDYPTAGILQKGQSAVSMSLLPYGSVMTKIEVSVFQDFSFGISYGGENLIGTGKINWYNNPGVNIKLKLISENLVTPAIAIGYDSQGKGRFINDYNRYEIKSPGLYIAASKNFEMLGYLALHGVVNYSFEREDGNKDMNLVFGVEKTIGSRVSIVAEYNVALNDNTGDAIGNGYGYFSCGIRFSAGEGFTVGLDLRDLLHNKKLQGSAADRGIYLEYVSTLF